MQIWDTAGQERFKTITQTYYKGSMGVILTYAVDDRDSFNNIENWMKQIKSQASESICKILVGNKSDVDSGRRKITTEEGKRLADSYGIPFFETSAKDDQNIAMAFQTIAKEIKDKILVETPPMNGGGGQNVNLNGPVTPKKKKDCCWEVWVQGGLICKTGKILRNIWIESGQVFGYCVIFSFIFS